MQIMRSNYLMLLLGSIAMLIIASGIVFLRDQGRQLILQPATVQHSIQKERLAIKRLEDAPEMTPLPVTWEKIEHLAEYFDLTIALVSERDVIATAYRGPAVAWGGRLTGTVTDLMRFALENHRAQMLVHFGSIRADASGHGQMIFAAIGVDDETID